MVVYFLWKSRPTSCG